MKAQLYIKWSDVPMLHVIIMFFLINTIQLKAQSISQIEYFFGTDPGVGNATPVSVNTNSGEITQSFSIPLGSLNEGFQSFTIRAQDNQGIWSLSSKNTFYITDVSFSNLSALEYWFDTDPGVGNGTPLSIPNAAEANESFVIPLGSLDVGFHKLGIRAQNTDGTWSLYDKRVFYVFPATDVSFSNLSALEYWFDNDPGVGNGTPLSIPNAAEANESFVIPLGSLDVGFHKLGIRAQNTDGTWSLYDKRVFYVFPAEELNTSPLVEMEFLFSVDPDSNVNENQGIGVIETFSTTDINIGTGITVPITPTGNPDEYLVEIPTDMVSCDVNNFWVYLENGEGQYSLYNILIDVDVFDDADPTIETFDNITVQLDANGQGSLDISDVDNGTFDDCQLVSVELNQTTFDYACGDLGSNTVTVTATDAVGKVSTQDVNINVVDNIAPVALANTLTLNLDANGQATIIADELDAGSTDNCSIVSRAVDSSTFDCSDVGDNTVAFTVTDASGNTHTVNTTVTIVDSETPQVEAQDITLQLDSSGQASISGLDIDNGSSDNCGISNYALDIDSFDCSHIGTNSVTLTVTDINGLSSSETALVTVVDNESPNIVTQDITVFLDTSGNASISESDIDNGSTDNCGIANTSIDISSFDCQSIGDNIVTYTVTDTNGNTSTSAVTVTVLENEAPVALTQDIQVELDSNGTALLTPNMVDNGSTDNCGIINSSLNITSFDCSNLGSNTVTFTVTDGSGNSDTSTANVTVVDNLGPNVIPQDITVQLDSTGNATINVADIDSGSTDNCGIVSSTLDITSFDCSDLGTNSVTLTVTDASGNSSSATAVVTIEDVSDPISVTQDITVQLDASGQATISASDIDNGSSDNCGIVTSTLDMTSFDCSDLGTNSVTLTVTDTSGNSNSANAVVTVVDDTNPVAVTQDITVELEANGQATISADDVDNGSGDNCSVASLTLDITAFDCSDLGDNTVTLSVQDADGNESSAPAVVTLVDNLAPIAVAQDISLSLDANGQAMITAADIDNGSSDNCGIVSSSLDISTFDCSNIGANTVTLTVQDASGNSSSSTATVTIAEDENPIAVAQDITVELDDNGQVSVTGGDVNNGSSDNCGITNFYLDVSSFDCADVGDNTVLFTVEDGTGNTDSVSVVVTVEDNLAPTAIGQDITIDLAGNPSISISPEDVNNGSFDNCSDVTLSIDEDTFTTIGDFPVVLTVEDELGNISSVTVIVTVEDTMGVVDNEIQIVEITVYPSPAEKLLYFETNTNIISYSIYDLFGKTVIDEANTNDQVNVELLADGVYFIKFNLHDDKYRIRKFVKR